jgi:hypothetical protein
MGPKEVLELMHSAPERYDSVRAALRYQGDGPTIKTVRDRFLRSEAGRRTFGEPTKGIRHSEPDGPFGWHCRVWLINHHRWRLELDLPGGGMDIAASTGRMRLVGTPEGPPGTSELWERRIGGDPPPDGSHSPRTLSGPCILSTHMVYARSTGSLSGWTS